MEDLTDNEREEQLRRWWSDNWAWIIGGIGLGLAILAGWQYWQRYQQQGAERDEAGYMAVLESLNREQREEAAKQAAELRERAPDSAYADQAELALARSAVMQRNFDEAARLLRGVADRSRDAELRLVARTRLARVLIEQGKHDEALALLDAERAGAFAGLVHELRGDALARKGDATGARAEYDAALAAANAESGLDAQFIELKRDALAGTGATVIEQPAAPVPEAAVK